MNGMAGANFGWQEVAVCVLVLAAAAWLLADVRRRRQKKLGCDSCGLAQAARRRR